MTNLTLVTNNPNPHHSNRPPPTLQLAHSQRYRRYPSGAPCWSELDNIWGDALIEAVEELKQERKREEWHRLAAMGVMLAEEERRFKTDPDFRRWLTEKARRETKGIKVLSTAKIDGGAYRLIELPTGAGKIEEWKPHERKWVPGGADIDEFWFTPPISRGFAAKLAIPWADVDVAPAGSPTSGHH